MQRGVIEAFARGTVSASIVWSRHRAADDFASAVRAASSVRGPDAAHFYNPGQHAGRAFGRPGTGDIANDVYLVWRTRVAWSATDVAPWPPSDYVEQYFARDGTARFVANGAPGEETSRPAAELSSLLTAFVRRATAG